MHQSKIDISIFAYTTSLLFSQLIRSEIRFIFYVEMYYTRCVKYRFRETVDIKYRYKNNKLLGEQK